MKTAVKISITCIEDGIRQMFPFSGPRRIARLSHIIYMDTPEGCCSCPIKHGQSIRIDSEHAMIKIEKQSTIGYNTETKMWEIIIGPWYMNCGITEKGIISEYGFKTVEVLQEGRS